jgi:hypothetical protein
MIQKKSMPRFKGRTGLRLPSSIDSGWCDWIRVMAGSPDKELENTRI